MLTCSITRIQPACGALLSTVVLSSCRSSPVASELSLQFVSLVYFVLNCPAVHQGCIELTARTLKRRPGWFWYQVQDVDKCESHFHKNTLARQTGDSSVFSPCFLLHLVCEVFAANTHTHLQSIYSSQFTTQACFWSVAENQKRPLDGESNLQPRRATVLTTGSLCRPMGH